MASDAEIKPQKEINRLKAKVRKLEKEKSKLFPDLGRSVYENHVEGRQEDEVSSGLVSRIMELDDEVSRLSAQIEDLQAQAKQLKAAPVAATAVCPSCGAPVQPGLKFCGKCGSSLTPQGPTGDTCPSCGSPVMPGTSFCGECGSPLKAAPAVKTASTIEHTAAPTATPAPPSAPAAPQASPGTRFSCS